ncbi:MAG: tetratricopeptide repeat protein, partial [Myxococcales bacterium]|nr:tetratricopeptide repeat protein [Myxococcales bacterium]
MKALVSLLLVAAASMFGGWDPFHRANPNVEEGNARVAAENYDGALEAYDLAARELPSAPGVHLDRGIAYLHKGERERAREAFLLAIGPDTPPDLVADVRYNLGLSFYQDGEAAAAEDD